MAKKKTQTATSSDMVGWQAIADYLGQPVAVAQRWGKDGMPVRRKGRNMVANPGELSQWLGRESGTGEAVHVSQSKDEDLANQLRRGLKAARARK